MGKYFAFCGCNDNQDSGVFTAGVALISTFGLLIGGVIFNDLGIS